MKVIDYIILIDKELRELAENVHQHIKDDYVPLGGIVINETYQGKEFFRLWLSVKMLLKLRNLFGRKLMVDWLIFLGCYLLFERMIGLFLLEFDGFEKKSQFKTFMLIPFSLVISFVVLCWEYFKSLYNKLGD